ncbi:MAG: hypothetical protein V4722_06875 [Bacteroidota bacterium]
MKNHSSYWYCVLSHFENNQYYENGLTIPFLIGSRNIIDPDQPIQDVEEFITEICESQYKVTIMWCTYLLEYVLSMLDSESDSMLKIYPDMYKGLGNLFVIDDSFQEVNTIAELGFILDSEYRDRLVRETYSKNGGFWTYFTEDELTRLNEIVAL